MKIKLLSLLLVTLALTSCTENKVYDQLDQNFPENRWQKATLKTFDFTIEQEAQNYDVNLHFAYLSDFQVNPIPMTLSILHPDGTEEKKEINLVVKDPEGKETGDCGGDYCDIRASLFEKEALPKRNL